MQVACPGCSDQRDLGTNIQIGDILSCDSCAGVEFRLIQDNGTYALREVPQASCPVCGTMLRLSDDIQAGATMDHCGQSFVVTYAYGTYALESTAGD